MADEEQTTPLDPRDFWGILLGKDDGIKVRIALTALVGVHPQVLRIGINELGLQESLMPMIDPSAWLDGTRFENVRAYKKVLEELLKLTEVLRAECRDPGIPDSVEQD